MEHEHTIGAFTAALTRTLGVQHLIEHRLLAQMIQEKSQTLIRAYVRAHRLPSPSVAQCIAIKEIRHTADGLSEILRIAAHFRLAPQSSLLESIRALLEFKLTVRKWEQLQESLVEKSEQSRAQKNEAPQPASPTKRIVQKESPVLNDTKKKIIEFIRKYPHIRTKDIIEEFSSVSDRTVKRNLKELVGEGMLAKHAEQKAVFYSAK